MIIHKQGYDTSKNAINDGFQSIFRTRGRIYTAETALYHQGDKADGFYRVNSGVIMVYRLQKDSQRQISGFYTKGDFFGLSSDGTHNDSAVAVTTANVASLSMTDLRQNQELQDVLFSALFVQLEDSQKLIATLTKKTASEKVASFLLMLAERQKHSGETYDMHLPMSRRDIADYLGVTIETVSRRFTKLKSLGIISLPNRNSVVVRKPSSLQSMAGMQ